MFLISLLLVAAVVSLDFQTFADAGCPPTSWSKTHYGGTVVFRPHAAKIEQPQPNNAAKPLRIVGYPSIANFVDVVLGFQAPESDHRPEWASYAAHTD